MKRILVLLLIFPIVMMGIIVWGCGDKDTSSVDTSSSSGEVSPVGKYLESNGESYIKLNEDGTYMLTWYGGMPEIGDYMISDDTLVLSESGEFLIDLSKGMIMTPAGTTFYKE